MNDEHNELNDIILKRNDKSSTRKKMLIGVGTLVIIAIVIIFVMGRMSESTPGQLPQPEQLTQQPQPMPPVTASAAMTNTSVPDPGTQQHLDEVVERVKSEVQKEPVPLEQSDIVVIEAPSETETQAVETAPAAAPKHQVSAEPVPAVSTPMQKPAPTPAAKPAQPAYGDVYIQVGSFSRYQPQKTFLANIERSGYTYTMHRVVMNGKISNKVLVGPFKGRSDARAHLQDVRRKIEPGAFIYTIKP
jgi:DedD protein